MRDGSTRKIKSLGAESFELFQENFRAKIVVVDGAQVGMEYLLDAPRKTIGRGPGVDLVCRNGAMSRQHAAIAFDGESFVVEDLGSTNGVQVDGRSVERELLTSGTRFRMGDQEFQLVVESRVPDVEVYEISVDG